MGASERQCILAVGGGAGVFSPYTRTKSASFVDIVKNGHFRNNNDGHTSGKGEVMSFNSLN